MKPFALLVATLVLVPTLPGSATAAPIVVTYDITGGTTFGGFLGNAPIQSGTAIVTMPNTASGSPPVTTTMGSIYLKLTATNSQVFQGTAGFPTLLFGSFRRGTARTLFALRSFSTFFGQGYQRTLATLRADLDGFLTGGRRSFLRVSYYTGYVPGQGTVFERRTIHRGVYDLAGQEVPEPSTSSLLGAALAGALGLLALPACMGLVRRRRIWSPSPRVTPHV